MHNRARALALGLLCALLPLQGYAGDASGSADAQVSTHFETAATADAPAIRMTGRAHRKRSGEGPKPFTRIEGDRIGLTTLDVMSTADFRPPFFNGKGIAAGDVDRDGFTDLLFGISGGIELYLNVEGKTFTRVPLTIPEIEDHEVFVVALVDVNDDGWLDIYLTSYLEGSHYIISERGKFSSKNLHAVNGFDTSLTHALSFGDIDRDGDLDAAIGNWFFGLGRMNPSSEATNELDFYTDGKFEHKPVAGMTGESLSILLSDFSGDRVLDYIVGNDFTAPDVALLGEGGGEFREVTAQNGLIPTGTQTTMSVDTADINNDLLLDIYLTQIAATPTGPATHVPTRPLTRYCTEINGRKALASCQRGMRLRSLFNWGAKRDPKDVKNCKSIAEPAERRMCRGMMMMMMAPQVSGPELCDRIPEDLARPVHFCRYYFKPPVEFTDEEWKRALPQKKGNNVLLVASEDSPFVDRATDMGVTVTGWSWNSKIMDLDNDEWQDIYVVNGTWRRESSPQKFFFHNERGDKFDDQTESFGLDSYMIVSAYVNADIDNDGDLDIVTNSVNGPAWLYRNNEKTNHAVSFEVRDLVGNHFGIGTQLILHYGEGETRHQIREIKSGGGYLSFDEPVAHFGLGTFDEFSRLEIFWSTGERSEIRGEFAADTHYLIERSPGSAPSLR